MRWLTLTFVSSVVLAAGCATAAPASGPAWRARAQQRTLHNNVARTDALARELRDLDVAALTDDDGRDSVIALARAQTCVALYAGAPNIAEHTVQLLDQYERMHLETHGSSERWGRRRIRVARRDAEIAAQDASVLQLPCGGTRSGHRFYGESAASPARAWGIDTGITYTMLPGSPMRSSGTVR